MTEPRVGRLAQVTIDCRDPGALAEFWGALLGMEIDERLGDNHYVSLRPAASREPVLLFQQVPEPKTVKNRFHLDLDVEGLEQATERVENLGARRAAEGDFAEYGWGWRVMLDPEGNEFCLTFEIGA